MVCEWCGETYHEEDAVDRTADGFWCDCCDGFTFFSQEERKKHRFLLLLENGSKEEEKVASGCKGPRFRKQLSPLRYPGGKSRMIDYLYGRFAAEKLDTFVELFAGGASLGLALLDAGVIRHLVLNDADIGVYSLWHTILHSPEFLIEKLKSLTPTHADLSAAKAFLGSACEPSEEAGWAFLLANRLSFSGIVMGNPMGGKKGTQEELLARWNPGKLIQRIRHIHSMGDQIEVYNKDACAFLEENWCWNTEKGTVFVDPPYWEKGPALYPLAFQKEDHERLAELLERLYVEFPAADFVVTYDNCQEIRQLYPLAEQEVVLRYYSI